MASDLNIGILDPMFLNPNPLDPGPFVLDVWLHELGHALGLRHPFDDEGLNSYAGRYLDHEEAKKTWALMAYAGSSQAIHLEPGHSDFVGERGYGITAPGGITVNFGTVIENLIGGNGDDDLSGNAIDNSIIGGVGRDTIRGYGGDDTLTGGAGDDLIFGDGGADIATFSGSRALYALTRDPITGFLRVDSAAEGADVLVDVETLQFADVMVDVSPPTVVITDDAPGTATGDVTYNLTFSEPVTDLAANDFSVTNGSVTSVSGSGASYSVVVTPTVGVEGSMSLSLLAGAVNDLEGNANAATVAAIQPIDTRAPTVIITDNVSGVANTATGTVVYTLVFSEPVLGMDGSDFSITNITGGTLSGSGTTYTVSVTPRTGVASGNIGLTLKAGAVTDVAGNPNTAFTDSSQAIDTVVPVAPKLVTTSSFRSLVDPQVTFHTTLGDVVFELNPAQAPVTVANLLGYVDTGYYSGTLFHRVIPGFVVQGGGFTTGLILRLPTYGPIELESDNGLSNLRGTLAMARTSMPDSATSQFFVNLVDNTGLNYANASSPGYVVFGHVVEGMPVIDSMALVPTITVGSFLNVPQTEIVISSAQQTLAGSSIASTMVFQVEGLESGATWQYSLDNGATWLAASGDTITVPAGSYAADDIQVRQTDAAGNLSAGGHFGSALVVDATAPTVSAFSPTDDAIKAPVSGNLTLTFSEAIERGTGTITLKNLEGAVLETFDAATSSRLTVSGNTLTLDPTPNLAYGTGYVLDFAAGAVQDLAGNGYAGGSGYNFTTTLVNPAVPKSAYYEISQKFYVAYFGRPADTGGLENMAQMFSASNAPTNLLDLVQIGYYSNQTVKDIIDSFGLSQESSNLYAGSDTTARVTAVYNFMFNRAPDAGGLAFWVSNIDSGVLSLAKAALSIMQGSENWPLEDGLTVDKKVTVAQNFTSALDTPTESSSYAGDAAAAAVRAMLGGVDRTSDTGAYEPNVLATIATLVASHPDLAVGRQIYFPADTNSDLGYQPAEVGLTGLNEFAI